MRLDWLHEHDAVPWRMFEILVKDGDGLYRWPDKPWLPLAFSLIGDAQLISRAACRAGRRGPG